MDTCIIISYLYFILSEQKTISNMASTHEDDNQQSTVSATDKEDVQQLNDINIQTIIQEAVKGISRSLPGLIEKQLEMRGVLSVSASEQQFSNQEEHDEDVGAPIERQKVASTLITNRDESAPPKQTRDISALDIETAASAENAAVNFDKVSYLLDNQNTRKRKHEDTLVLSEELLASIEEEMDEEKETGEKISQRWADQIKHAYIEASSESSALNKIMKMYPKPENLDIKVPKLNREIELNPGFQKNNKYVSSNEKAFYATQNYVGKSITIFSKIGEMILNDSDKSDTGSSLNYKDLLQMCVHGSTLLGHVQAELTQKRKNNLRSIVHPNYVGLCGPRPGSQAAKKKPKNIESQYLLGDNLKSDAKMAKTSCDMFKATPTSSGRKGSSSYVRKESKNDFLYHGRKSNGQKKSQMPYLSKDFKNNRSSTNKKKN